jgi:hypothetical protein
VRLPFQSQADRTVRLKDLMSPANHERDGDDLLSQGLYLDLPAWGCHLFGMAIL